MRRRAFVALICLLGVACASDRVPLSYHLEAGRRLEHRLRLEARITRTLQGRTAEQHVVAVFRATQETSEPTEEGAQATFSLVPEMLVVDGRDVDPGPDQEFVVQLAPDGRVIGIAAAGGSSPTSGLGPVGLERLLPRLRPVLPGRPVRPGDTWRSDTEFVDETGTFSLDARSRLTQLGVVEGREAALVRTTYESPVDRQEVFANAVANMRGADVGAQEAWFALDGYLIEATGDSVGSYRVSFTPPGEEVQLAPVQASLVVRLHSELRLLSAA